MTQRAPEGEMRPKRIQRKRTKGWRMPDHTIYVGRGSAWGNPFTWADGDPVELFRREVAPVMDVALLRGWNLACWCRLGQPCHADVLLELANA